MIHLRLARQKLCEELLQPASVKKERGRRKQKGIEFHTIKKSVLKTVQDDWNYSIVRFEV